MKTLKILYKIIFLIILITVLLFINSSTIYAGNNDVTDPKENPAGGSSWSGWYCAEAGHSYWGLNGEYQFDKNYYKDKTVKKSSTDGEEWHVLRVYSL